MKPHHNILVAVGVAACFGGAAILIVVAARTAWNRSHRPPPAAEPYDEQAALKAAEPITPEMVGYEETGGFTSPFHESRAIAIDGDERIYLAGDQGIAIFSRDGQKTSEIPLKGSPQCIAVGGFQHAAPGQIYIGMAEHVEVFDPKGEHIGSWSTCGPEAYLSSITTTDFDVWAADAGNRVVWRYDPGGKPLKPLGNSATSTNGPEFVVANHYFDVAAGHNDLVYIVNPGHMRIEGYTLNGDHETNWGHGSPDVADFFGNYNPVHLSVLPDGYFITAEQGIPRVKIYTQRGDFKTVVAAPPTLREPPTGVVGDRHGRIYVLDAGAAKIRIFAKKAEKEKPR